MDDPAPQTTTGELVFVHDFGPHPADRWGPVVALTPQAAVAQRAAGIEPLVCQDLVDAGALRDRNRAWLRWQLAWADRLAERAGLAADVVHGAFALLKNPLDALISMTWLYRTAVAHVGPDRVVYVGPSRDDESDPWHGDDMWFAPSLGDRPLADRLLPAVCASLAIDFVAERWEERVAPASPVAAPTLKARLREALALTRNFAGTGTWRRHGGAGLLLWPASYGARTLAAEAHRRGERVLLLDRRRARPAVKQSLPAGWRTLGGPFDPALPPQTPLDPALSPSLDELAEWTSVPAASAVLADRLATYAQRICPAVERVATQARPVLRSSGVTDVLDANPYTVAEFGCLVAAGREGIRRTLVQHGDHAYSYDFWLVQETQNFERLLASDSTVPADMTEAAAAIGCPVPTFEVASPRIDEFLARQPPRAARTGPPTVCYLPTHYTGDTCALINGGAEDGWYVRWQRRLLNLMAELDEWSFIWKAFPAGALLGAADPFEALTAAVPNVDYVTEHFRSVASRSDRVLMDFSSTALYEARALGLPSLSISFTRNEEIRPGAQAMFEGVIVRCDTTDDAAEAVRTFLRDPPGDVGGA